MAAAEVPREVDDIHVPCCFSKVDMAASPSLHHAHVLRDLELRLAASLLASMFSCVTWNQATGIGRPGIGKSSCATPNASDLTPVGPQCDADDAGVVMPLHATFLWRVGEAR